MARNAIGVVQLEGKKLIIQPKVAVKSVLFLLSYTWNPEQFDQVFDLKKIKDTQKMEDLLKFVVEAFLQKISQSLKNGTLQGYQEVTEGSNLVRGRVDWASQMR